jgi:hypothetical protein
MPRRRERCGSGIPTEEVSQRTKGGSERCQICFSTILRVNEGAPDDQLSRTARFDRWVRHSPPVLIVGLVLFLLTTAGAVAGAVVTAKDWYDGHYRWRESEYSKLVQLHSDLTLERFEEVLGAAWFKTTPKDGNWVGYSFRGRDYWVQAVTRRRSSTVSLYAVTSCSTSFRPTFRLADATPITLNRSTLASVSLNSGFPVQTDYFFPGATANARVLETHYGVIPGTTRDSHGGSMTFVECSLG